MWGERFREEQIVAALKVKMRPFLHYYYHVYITYLVTAPSEAEETSFAYLAITPLL